MDRKFNFTSEELLNIKFPAKDKGYEALKVDEVLDLVIEDYRTYDKEIKNLHDENAKHLHDEEKLNETIAKNELELAKWRNKYNAFPKGEITNDNRELLFKVNQYEKALHRKGVDLKKALSDPDNC